MAKGVKLDDAQLQQIITKIDGTTGRLDTYVKQLDNLVASLGPAWSGEAATAYRHSQTQLNADQRALAKVLRGIRAAIEETKRSHGTNDSDIAAGMRGIGGASGGTGAAGGGPTSGIAGL
ncbi:WXG100 family type VII secretion target [Streptomyces durbertensis]|uniref:WXG100 family type VII secretion target n=1 Tax=Streptomyces durbertensis TaxID=2448886 RepID=A0ABR6EHJ6_9ACTN|nr:WXG100 family type VII secretion target [Streptomyces durbertensis]MBB1244532.1 WXG100 family type VII secretion target [Streptomyces durbertensis]